MRHKNGQQPLLLPVFSHICLVNPPLTPVARITTTSLTFKHEPEVVLTSVSICRGPTTTSSSLAFKHEPAVSVSMHMQPPPFSQVFLLSLDEGVVLTPHTAPFNFFFSLYLATT